MPDVSAGLHIGGDTLALLGRPAVPAVEARVAILSQDAAASGDMASLLRHQGMTAWHCATLREVLDSLAQPARRPDLVVLDARGRSDGALAALEHIRCVSDLPCAVLGASASEAERIRLLEAGADDCLGAEVSLREVLVRLRVLMRRAMPRAAEAAAAPREVLELGAGWKLCRRRRDLYRPDGERCLLTTAEFNLLDTLAEAGGRTVSRDEICRTVFRRRHWAEDRSVDNLVVRLRRKLEPDRRRPEVIRSVRPLGYMFAGFPEMAGAAQL